MKKILILLAIPLAIFVAYFFLAPAGIDPAPYQPPEGPEMIGEFAPNNKLTQSELLARGMITGPEDVDQDADGRVVAGLANGDIIAIGEQGKPEVLVNTGGRPLGLEYDDNGNLWIADAHRGLLMLSTDGELSVKATEAGGQPLGFTDDLDIAADGTVYFSDASTRWSIEHYRMDAMEAKPYGRLLRYSPHTGKTEVLLDGLYFANGIALSADESFVLVNETFRYRVTRYWLSGDKAGTSDTFMDNLPGFPDGISGNRNGLFWIAMATPRNTMLDKVHPYPWAKKLIVKLPPALQPQPLHYGFVLGVNEKGEVMYNLQDPAGEHLYEVTSVEEVPGALLLGTLSGDRIGRLPLEKL